MKEKILYLLREMTNDSKSVSYKAEKQLCNILTDAIIILRKIEEKVGRYEREYPNKIWNIYEDIRYSKLPSEIECNDGDFCFETKWLDINPKEYFETLKKKKINSIENSIFHTKQTLCEYERDLQHLKELKFEDL